MKMRRSIFLFIIVVATLIALVLWHGKKQPTETPATAVATNAVLPAATEKSSTTSVPVQVNTPLATAVATNAAKPTNQTKGEQIKEELAEMNDVPINFYGRLADQFGSPVAGAQIAADVRIYNGVQSTVRHLKTVSDGNGLFQIEGGKGESLGVMPKKTGYVLATTDTYFKYSYMYPDHFSSDPNNPTVIKMWKLQGAEPLASINQDYKLHYTDAPINFDLVVGKIVPSGGDVKITVKRPTGIVSEHNPQDWSVQVEAADGGLIETTVAKARTTYAAPADGYQPNATFTMSTATQSWHAAVDQMFFLESRNGRVFGKVRLILGINETPDGLMDITFSGVANTNSSPNWEATVSQ